MGKICFPLVIFGFLALFLCIFSQSASATTIDPLTWEQFASDADFIGIVECETAGGIVS
jgi:hypothetical protein